MRTAASFVQGLVAGGGVLVAEGMYANLNNNVATSVLAGIASVMMGVVLVVLVWGDHRKEAGGEMGDEVGQRGLLEKKPKKKERSRKRKYTSGDGEGAFEVEMAGGWTAHPWPCIV